MASVLLVNADTTVLGSVGLFIAADGHTVHTAVNGMDALRQVRIARPDVVVADCDLPVMDGVDLAREMQADPTLASLPLVLLMEGPHRPRVRVFAVLRAPFGPTRLLKIIKRIDRRDSTLRRSSFTQKTRDAMMSACRRVARRRTK